MKFLIVVAVLVTFSTAKKYEKCELAVTMFNAGFSKSSLPDWLCLVEFESSYNTKAIGRDNADGTTDWGIFQINDGYWCSSGNIRKGCNVKCNDLLNDDIQASMRCAKIVYNDPHSNGFHAWNGWKAHCKGKSLREYSIDSCFNNEF